MVTVELRVELRVANEKMPKKKQLLADSAVVLAALLAVAGDLAYYSFAPLRKKKQVWSYCRT